MQNNSSLSSNLDKKNLALGLISVSSLASTATSTAAITVTHFGAGATSADAFFTFQNFGDPTGMQDWTVDAVSGMAGTVGTGSGFARSTDTSTVPASSVTSLNYFFKLTPQNTGTVNDAQLGDDNYLFYDKDGDGTFESVAQFFFDPATTSFPIGANGYLVAIAEDTMLDPANPLTIQEAALAIQGVPEVSSSALLALGATGLGFYRRRRKLS